MNFLRRLFHKHDMVFSVSTEIVYAVPTSTGILTVHRNFAWGICKTCPHTARYGGEVSHG